MFLNLFYKSYLFLLYGWLENELNKLWNVMLQSLSAIHQYFLKINFIYSVDANFLISFLRSTAILI